MTKNKKVKNYIILAIILILGMGLTLYMCDCYKVYNEYQKQTPVIRGTLSEITNEDLSHYIMENPSAIIYMCTSSDDTCRKYEKKLVKLVNNMDLSEYLVYLNLSDVDKDIFVEKFNEEYANKKKLSANYPAFVTFEDGKVEYILQGNKDKPLTISKTKDYFELNNIGE